ncbi:MAG: NAD(P)H-binding protein, partial [Weissella confusa]
MKIAVIGATGMAGQAVFEEATKRGHAVTAIVRDADKAREKLGSDATILVGDLFEMHADVFEEFDVVVNAFANHKDAYLNLDALTQLLKEVRRFQTIIMGSQ